IDEACNDHRDRGGGEVNMKPTLFAVAVFRVQAFGQETPRGVIRGRVIRAGNSSPIADATITLRASGSSASAAALAHATSGDDGRFALSAPPGQYTLTVQQDGYFWEAQDAPTDVATIRAAVTAGKDATEISVSLTRAAVIAGRVIDSTGQRLARANVDALMVSYQNGSPALKRAASRTSNDLGEFRLFWLYPGEYVIQASPQAVSTATTLPVSLKAFHPNATDLSAATRITVKAGD